MLSSSVEVPSPGGMSGLSVAARNVVRSSSISGAMYSLEKSPGGGGPDSASLAGNKKRRSSLGAKMVAIVGLSQWSKSTQQLNQQGQSESERSRFPFFSSFLPPHFPFSSTQNPLPLDVISECFSSSVPLMQISIHEEHLEPT